MEFGSDSSRIRTHLLSMACAFSSGRAIFVVRWLVSEYRGAVVVRFEEIYYITAVIWASNNVSTMYQHQHVMNNCVW